MPIGPRIKRYTGILTADGAGAATVDLNPGAGYKLLRANVDQGDATGGANQMTGGTAILRENAGAGTTRMTVTGDNTFNPKGSISLPVPATVLPVRLTLASAGAGRSVGYSVWFARTRTH